MISPQEITYFLECARTENLSRAAERLGITQPALTMALKRLEESLSVELFHRSKKGVRLTKAGELFQTEAKSLADQWDRLTKVLGRSVDELRGSYTIGCHHAVALYSLPQTLPQVLQDFPNLTLELHHDLSRKIMERVIKGELDIALVVNPVRHPDLVIKPVAKDEFGFWTAKEANDLNRTDGKHPVLICEPELLQAQHLLRKLRSKFPRTVHSGSLEVIASLANSGAGIGLLPGRVAQQWKNLKHLPELPVFQDEIALLYRAENRRVAAFRELAQRLEKGML
ncbi:MAG TPA: LysR family transcriptional regulator [Bdellovibrionota bacterium]|jgi:DNA-binding transcriptional LysR family regulator